MAVKTSRGAMFSYISLEDLCSRHTLFISLLAVVNALLATMSTEFEAAYARQARLSVLPESV